jgi:Skp family chaperone for outer membrane proteins
MQLLQEWQNEFSEEIYQLSQEAEKDGQKKAKEALEKTAKAKGFTGVFSSQVMPYSVNNLTEEVIKTMNGETKKESKKK